MNLNSHFPQENVVWKQILKNFRNTENNHRIIQKISKLC